MQIIARSGDLGPTWFHMAIRAIVVLSETNQTLSSNQLSDLLGAESTYIRKILSNLIDKKLITAKSGRYGGYVLAKNPKEITMLDIYLAFSQGINEHISSVQSTGTEMYISLVIDEAEKSFQNVLKKYTIHHLIELKMTQ